MLTSLESPQYNLDPIDLSGFKLRLLDYGRTIVGLIADIEGDRPADIAYRNPDALPKTLLSDESPVFDSKWGVSSLVEGVQLELIKPQPAKTLNSIERKDWEASRKQMTGMRDAFKKRYEKAADFVMNRYKEDHPTSEYHKKYIPEAVGPTANSEEGHKMVVEYKGIPDKNLINVELDKLRDEIVNDQTSGMVRSILTVRDTVARKSWRSGKLVLPH